MNKIAVCSVRTRYRSSIGKLIHRGRSISVIRTSYNASSLPVDNRLHLASCHNRISDMVRLSGVWLEHGLPENRLYERRAVIRRLQQRLADLLHYPFLVQQAAMIETSSIIARGAPTNTVECAGLSLYMENGRVRPGLPLVARSLWEFAKHWFYILALATAALLRPTATRPGPSTLVFGVGEADLHPGGSDAEFLEFCRSGPIDPLRNATRIIVQSNINAQTSQPGRATFARDPLFVLLRESGLGLAGYMRFYLLHLASLWFFVIDVARLRLLCVLDRDYAYFAIITTLNHGKFIENLVITNSMYSRQPLWMTDIPGRRYRVHMVFYSMMSNPFVYKVAPLEAIFPGFRYLRADEFWVWTPGQATFLKSLGITGNFHVEGPLVWRMPSPRRRSQSRSLLITVFDVTPVTSQFEKAHGLSYNYFKTSCALGFINGILTAREQINRRLGVELQIVLKHKRSYQPIHDNNYIRQVNAWCNISREIDLAPPDSDVLSLIQDSKLAIVMPFSSPAYIAAHLGVPAVYYDPSGELLPTFERHPLIHFASGPDKLCALLMRTFTEVTRQSLSIGAAD